MFFFRSQPQRPAVNIITLHPPTDTDERTARHLAICRELAELAMELACAAARGTLRTWQAEDATEPAAGEEGAQTAKAADPGLLFARLSTAVRQAITLEARIAAGPQAFNARTPRGPALRPPPDERRATIRQVLHEATEHHPDRTAFRKEIAERIEEEIAADPDGEIHMGDMLDSICDDLDIEINWNKIHDAVLEKLTAPIQGGEAEPVPEPPPEPPTFSEPWHSNITHPRTRPH